jgi:hypothetical protein
MKEEADVKAVSAEASYAAARATVRSFFNVFSIVKYLV